MTDIIKYAADGTPLQRLSGSPEQVLLNVDEADVIRATPVDLIEVSDAPAPEALPPLSRSDIESELP